MKKNRLYRKFLYFVLIAIFFLPAQLIHNSSAAPVATLTPHSLTSSIQVGIKSILNEKIEGGYRIAAVVYMHNHGTKNLSVPDYELRAVTADGVTYYLKPSIDNIKMLQPKETIELSYMLDIKRKDSFFIQKVHFVAVDEYVYPKKETRLTTIWVAGKEWNGSGSQIYDASKSVEWGKSFTLLESSTDLVFTPLQYYPHSTVEGSDLLIALQVHNTGKKKVKLPVFTIEGRSPVGVYEGTAIGQQEDMLFNAGEKKILYYMISIPSGETLKRITILTPERFKLNEKTEIIYNVGRIQLVQPYTKWNASSYSLGSSIQKETSYLSLSSTLDISIAELTRFKETGSSYQTAVVKLQMTNQSNQAIYVPKLDVELMTNQKVRYTGSKLQTALEILQPNLSYTVQYMFKLPTNLSEQAITVNLLDQPYGIPFTLPIASLNTFWQSTDVSRDNTFIFYPYQMKVNSWSIHSKTTDKLEFTMDLNIRSQDNVVVNSNSSKVTFELVDSNQKVIGVHSIKLDGSFTSGKQIKEFDLSNSAQAITINVYETFETSQGETKRLLGKLR